MRAYLGPDAGPVADPRFISSSVSRASHYGEPATGVKPGKQALESLPEALAEAGRQLRTLSVRLPASVLPRRHLNNLS